MDFIANLRWDFRSADEKAKTAEATDVAERRLP
jgi:hypothetical protein